MIIGEGQVEEVLAPLPVDVLWGVGAKTTREACVAGDKQCRAAKRGPGGMGSSASSGKWADSFFSWQGIDDRPVECEWEAKSLGAESTFPADLFDVKVL